MKISLKTSSYAECGVGYFVIFSVYPTLFGVFGSSFPRLPEFPKYHKACITQLSCSFYDWMKLDFYSNILDNQSYYFHWSFWCIISNDVELHVNDQSKKWLAFKFRKLIGKKTGHFINIWWTDFDWWIDFSIFSSMHMPKLKKLLQKLNWSPEMLQWNLAWRPHLM